MKRIFWILPLLLFAVPASQASGIGDLLSDAIQQRAKANISAFELEGPEVGDGKGHHGPGEDSPSTKTWVGNATFFNNPALGFEFQWKAIELFEDVRLIQVMRMVDGAGQNGIMAELESADIDFAVHPAFGADAASCKYFFLGKKTGQNFSGVAYYVCGDGTKENGNFSAQRVN
ncbi:MAG: hypothetical protein LJE84_08970 [Gammaproteobacteria bacterium]|nr:hypothetical protein [Gammaproteobacteria bacterium]